MSWRVPPLGDWHLPRKPFQGFHAAAEDPRQLAQYGPLVEQLQRQGVAVANAPMTFGMPGTLPPQQPLHTIPPGINLLLACRELHTSPINFDNEWEEGNSMRLIRSHFVRLVLCDACNSSAKYYLSGLQLEATEVVLCGR